MSSLLRYVRRFDPLNETIITEFQIVRLCGVIDFFEAFSFVRSKYVVI